MVVKTLRSKKRLSQEELAESSGLSLRTIQRVERGHRVSYATLRALAQVFEIDVDKLEYDLYSQDKIIEEYKDYPRWLRFYLGTGWFTATRAEFKKTEIFFLIVGSLLALIWLVSALMEIPLYRIAMFGCLACFFGAYNISISIRIGDKYQVWTRLERTLPNRYFGLFKKS